MIVYLDGYNYLFIHHDFSDQFDAGRKAVLDYFSEKTASLSQLKLRVVFDAYKQPEELSRTFYRNLEVIYTSPDQSADAFILEKVEYSKSPGELMVVSNDKVLIKKIKAEGALTCSFEEFLVKLNMMKRSSSCEKDTKPFNDKDYQYFLDRFNKG